MADPDRTDLTMLDDSRYEVVFRLADQAVGYECHVCETVVVTGNSRDVPEDEPCYAEGGRDVFIEAGFAAIKHLTEEHT